MRRRGRGCTSCAGRWSVPTRPALRVVEVDETFVGGVSRAMPAPAATRCRSWSPWRRPDRTRTRTDPPRDQPPARQPRPGRVRRTHGRPGSTIRTDGARMLRRLAERGYIHEYITRLRRTGPGEVLPGVHLAASQLKRWLTGTLHFAVAETSCPTTSTSSPSASTAAPPRAAGCCSIGSSSRQRTQTRRR